MLVLAFGGWCTAGGLGLLLLLEWSGLFTRLVELELRSVLNRSSEELTVGEARLSWLDRTLVVEDLALGPDGSEAYAEQMRVLLNWRPGPGVMVERVVVSGGHLHVSTSLQETIEDMRSEGDGRPVETSLPDLALEDFVLSAEGPNGSSIALGRLDAHLAQQGARQDLVGRVVLPGTTGELWLTGGLAADGALEWVGTGEDLVLGPGVVPETTLREVWDELAPSGAFDLTTSGRYEPGVSVLPEVTVQVTLRDGSLRLPHVERADDRRVHDVVADLEAHYRGGAPEDLWRREAWELAARIEAGWEGITPTLCVRGGTSCSDDLLAEAWLSLPAVGLEGASAELLEGEKVIEDLRGMLDTDGSAAVSIGARFPAGWTPDTPRARAQVASCVTVHATGDLSVAYVGEENRRQDMQRNLGFPLRVDDAHGRVTHCYDPSQEFREQLGLFNITGRHSGGPVRVEGSMWAVPRWPDRDARSPEPDPREPRTQDFHLTARSTDLPVDADLEAALAGLSGVEGIEDIFPTYAPSGGALNFTLDLRKPVERRFLATRLAIELDDLDVRWAPFPAPMQHATGTILFESNGREGDDGRTRLVIQAEGTSPVARDAVELRGRIDGHGKSTHRSWIEASVDELNVRDPELRETLRTSSPEVHQALLDTRAAGFLDLTAVHVQTSSEDAPTTRLELTAAGRGLQGRPSAFPMDTRGVRGRATVRLVGDADDREAPARVTTRASMEGRWLGNVVEVPIAFSYLGQPDEASVLDVQVAGVDLENPTVTGALVEALMQQDGRETDTSRLDFAGHIDADCTFVLAEEAGAAPLSSELSLMARLDSLGLGGIELLRRVEGPFTYEGATGRWTAERVTAVMGSTPVTLTDLELGPRDDGMRLGMNLAAVDVPFDDEHLQHFLDEGTRRTLLEELRARGRFDVLDSRLTLDSRADGETSLMFDDARLRIRRAALTLGVPVEVESADDVVMDLRYERGRVRAMGRIGNLEGRVAGRQLRSASMWMTFVEPRLTIEDMSGEFEMGYLRSLGHGARGGAGFFSVDLVDPFPFSLSTELRGVDVGSLTAGAFNSDFANEGRLDAELRLQGDLLHPTGIRGSGYGKLTDSSLWAIPVFQALFSQLGFDSTAIFSEMEAHLDVAQGVIDMQGMRVKSDLLSLVGDGRLDMDGSLSHDLEVRYSLVDQLGPLTRLLYGIQNSLLRVSIRGDMSRPQVILKGLFSQFLAAEDEGLRLPVPGLSGLPARF